MDTQDRSERGSGRTYRMVMDVPHTGGVIVAPSTPLAHYIREMIRDTRGPVMSKKIDVVAIEGPADVRKIQGETSRPIFLDHSCLDGSAGRFPPEQALALKMAGEIARFITERCRGR